ncbi:MAG: 23S rRNA (adenine(2503)-C(2))-methyltransferase RlmN [Phycisphaerales bacterium]|nr:23S rRNA (adenine(2503)-C(2))-methyltransferase RlmN [Phycisphaerales bacterium]
MIDPADILGMTSAEFAARAGERGVSREAAVAAYRGAFRENRALPARVAAALGGESPRSPSGLVRSAPVARVLREQTPEGEIIKFTQALSEPIAEAMGPSLARLPPLLPQGALLETESVLIPMIGRGGVPTYTLCVSSQVGCAMGCGFCETAQMGLVRSLSAAEIVGQWHAARWQVGIAPKNVVFMGMGEPMDNLDAVVQAIAVLTGHDGPGVPMSKITVSTVGRIDGLRRLGERVRTPGWHRLGLAVSVNAPNDGVRSRIMPINRAMPMAALRRALDEWPLYAGAKVCIEYVLIPGVNDAPEHARELAGWVRGLPACVNLIPYNPRRQSPWDAPSEQRVAEFLGWLLEAGAYAKRRRTKGRDLMGACGQLGSEGIRRRRATMPG